MTTSFHDDGKLFQLMRHSTKMGTQREQGEEGFFLVADEDLLLSLLAVENGNFKT